MPSPFKPESTVQTVFREISDHAELSARDLSDRLCLNPATLEENVRKLEQMGLVTADRVSGSEQKGQYSAIRVDASYGYLLGIDLGASHLHFALTDFCGEIISESNTGIRPEDGPGKMIEQIKENIRQIVSNQPSPANQQRNVAPKLEGIGIGVPSPVHPRTGLVSWANNLPGWTNIELGGELRQAFGVPVALENDANMAAIGERWRGVARDVPDFVFIALGTGIGSAVFANGSLVRGRTGAAGELYRLNIEWQRWDEDFGENGYYESHVSGSGIAAEGRKQLVAPGAKNGADRPQPDDLARERDAYFVFEAFRSGNQKARQILERTFMMLGVGIADLVAVLDPELIVLGGGITKGAPELMLATVERVARRIQPDLPAIKLSALEDKAQTYGAIFSALMVARDEIRRNLG
jgi:glucokinase